MLLQLATGGRTNVDSTFPRHRLVSQRWPRREPAFGNPRVLLVRYHRPILLSLTRTSDNNDLACARSTDAGHEAGGPCSWWLRFVQLRAVAEGFEPSEGSPPHTLSR